ncbi:ParA family protein [Alicyclobacillus macrosporangiidus]|uniref:Chromosome partitioning protein n=1 Tax=Alicyclobacillus macrosporangiidus TaxID=392015 RepID=A0A1I7L2T0_9BACL|nr:ParA family protein [Alicyclobacillus macrosporangiidus]SFV03945.1 chromosome partitioning protein [Alicyclobacillus macrosporangiidus]
MATKISFGIQKGGCSKTTTSGIFIHQLVTRDFRGLAIDMDSQGNLTELLTNQSANEFADRSVLEAIRDENIHPYIYKITDKLHILPANNLLATLPRLLYQKYGFHSNRVYTILRDLLREVEDEYDYIIIDTPPALSEHTVQALVASDWVVVMFECSQWCFSAIPNFMDSVEVARKLNPHLQVAGIVRTLNDIRRSDNKEFNELIAETYPDLVFETIIRRKAATGRLPIYGLGEANPEMAEALAQYESLFEEVMRRVQ